MYWADGWASKLGCGTDGWASKLGCRMGSKAFAGQEPKGIKSKAASGEGIEPEPDSSSTFRQLLPRTLFLLSTSDSLLFPV